MSSFRFLIIHKDLARLLLARFCSFLGDNVHAVATMWLVKEMTGSATAMASVLIANTLPRILFGIIGGVSVDRYDRKKILVVSDGLRAAGVLLLAILAAAHELQVWQVALFAAFSGAVSCFFAPGVSATIPHLVQADELQRANALNSLCIRLAGILGAAVGGWAITLAGIWSGYVLDSLSFAVSALLIVTIAVPRASDIRQHITKGMVGVWQDTKEGWSYILNRRELVAVVLLSTATLLVTLPAAQLVPLLADELLLADAFQMGLLWSGMTLGLLLGAWLMNSTGEVTNGIAGAFASGITCAASALLIFLLPSYLPILLAFVLMGASLSISMLLTTTYFQTHVPTEMQGRFFGNTGLVTLGIQPLVMWATGIAADASSAADVFGMLGGVLALFCLVWGVRYRAILRRAPAGAQPLAG